MTEEVLVERYGKLEQGRDGRWQLRFERQLAHPQEKVWRAITEPEHLAAWFPSTIEGERAAGARLRFSFPDGVAEPIDGVMLAYDPMSLLELYRRLLEAWNEHDAEAFAGLFGRDGVSIGFDGSQAQGPEIRQHIGAVFSDHRTASYVAKVLAVRRLGDECALLRSMVGMIPPGRDQLNPDVNALQ